MHFSDLKTKAAKYTNPFEGHATPAVEPSSSSNQSTSHQMPEVYQAPPPYSAEQLTSQPSSQLPDTASLLKDGTRRKSLDALPSYDSDKLMNTPDEELTAGSER
jgi:hypothetical protein